MKSGLCRMKAIYRKNGVRLVKFERVEYKNGRIARVK